MPEVDWGLLSASPPVEGVMEVGWGPFDCDAAVKVLSSPQGSSAARIAL